jgi:HNH endonuclease
VTGAEQQLEQAVQLLEYVVATFVPERLDGDAALTVLSLFAQVRRVAEAGEALAARRIDACGAYRRSGHRSAAHLVAATSGVALDRAATTVAVGRRLRGQSATDAAFRRGELSLDQAGAVSEAAEVAPDQQQDLVDRASRETVGRLRERSRALRRSAGADRETRYERQRSLRTFRHGVDREGMVWGQFRLPPDSGAAVVNRVEREADRCYRAADPDGRRHEPHERHAADALVTVVTGTAAPSGRGAELVVHVSRDALLRGTVADGELCRIEGVGDVPVDVARQLLDDAFLKGVLVDGTEVHRVKHFSRRASAAVRTALTVEAGLDDGAVRCSVQRCDRRAGIEWDHVEPHARGGPTEIANLQPLCRYHHREKTAGRLGVPP